MPLTRDEELRELLTSARTIAVVGASDRPERASYGVMRALQGHGYRMLPVNPDITGEHVHGEFVWRELAQIGLAIDIVNIFRRSDAAGEAVDQAIAVGAKAVWLQLGVIDQAAAERAEAAGLAVVMDHCIKIELRRLGIAKIEDGEPRPRRRSFRGPRWSARRLRAGIQGRCRVRASRTFA